MRNILYCVIIFVLATQTSNAQVFRHFQNAEFDNEVYSNSPDKKLIRDKEIAFEQYYKNDFLLFEENKQITLPLVFNFIISDSETISYEQIISQINALNRAFGNKIGMPKEDYFHDYAVDTELSFCVSEFSNEFIRIRKKSDGTKFKDMQEMKQAEKGIEPYYPEKFINIWVCDLDSTSIDKQKYINAGFAQLPLRHISSDGIVINKNLFGRKYENELYPEGYTLVHLMGVYLGIKPLTGFGPCEGDGVEDTPDINSESLICWEQTENFYVSTGCYFNERRMTRNFMDNVPDSCAAMFTFGQKSRMQANLGLKGPRHGLVDEKFKDCINSQPTTVNYETNPNDIYIYPNPSKNTINVECNFSFASRQNAYYQIFNLMGQKIKTGLINNNIVTIDVQSWMPGYYLFVSKLTDGNIVKKAFEVIK